MNNNPVTNVDHPYYGYRGYDTLLSELRAAIIPLNGVKTNVESKKKKQSKLDGEEDDDVKRIVPTYKVVPELLLIGSDVVYFDDEKGNDGRKTNPAFKGKSIECFIKPQKPVEKKKPTRKVKQDILQTRIQIAQQKSVVIDQTSIKVTQQRNVVIDMTVENPKKRKSPEHVDLCDDGFFDNLVEDDLKGLDENVKRTETKYE